VRMEKSWEIAKMMVVDLTRGSVENHQPGAVSWLGGFLRDPIRWQIVVEVGGAQALLVQDAKDHVEGKGEQQADNHHSGQGDEARNIAEFKA